MIVFFSGTLQVHLPRHRRLRRPVQEQGRGVRLLRAGQFHQQQNAQRLAEEIIEKKFELVQRHFSSFLLEDVQERLLFVTFWIFLQFCIFLFFVCQ